MDIRAIKLSKRILGHHEIPIKQPYRTPSKLTEVVAAFWEFGLWNVTTINTFVAIHQELYLNSKTVLEGQFMKEQAALHARKHTHARCTRICKEARKLGHTRWAMLWKLKPQVSNFTNVQIAKVKQDSAKGKKIPGLARVCEEVGEGVLRKENSMNVEFVSIFLGWGNYSICPEERESAAVFGHWL